ncbi:MAG TPA: hypothetical protein VF727_04600 [Allosphingosinicella sp.]|jgi:hypothetical protein
MKGMILGAAIAAAPWGAAAAAPAAQVSIEDLGDIPFISAPELSPDGTKLLAKVNVDGREALAVYDLTAAADTAPKFVPYRGAVRWYGWAGNGRVLVGQTLINIIFGSVPIPLTRLTRHDLKTGQSTDIGQGGGFLRDNVVFTDPDGRYVLVAAQKDLDDSPAVVRVDLATGASTEVQKKKAGILSWSSTPAATSGAASPMAGRAGPSGLRTRRRASCARLRRGGSRTRRASSNPSGSSPTKAAASS